MATATPSRIGPFRIERRLLHQPGVGSVYAAHAANGEPVMLRVLTFAGHQPPAARRAHAAAMRLWRAIAHPGLVGLVDSGDGRDGPWVATERAAHSALATQLLRGGPLAPARALALLAPVAGALDHVHERGLVCDTLSAHTLVIRGTSREETGMLAEIGPGWPAAWRPGRLLGPLDGLAPEEIRGAAPSPASNVYALTAVLLRCLTGEAPFPAASRAATLLAHLHATPPRPSAGPSGLPPALDDVVASGLAKTPQDRPGSAAELIRQAAGALGVELEPVAEPLAEPAPPLGRPVAFPTAPASAPVASTDGAASPPSRTRRATLALTLLAPAAVLLGWAAYAATRPAGDRPPVSREPPPAFESRPGRTVASVTLRPPDGSAAGRPTGAVRIDVVSKRLVITIAGNNLPAEGGRPRTAYTVWLLNSREDALRLGTVEPPVGSSGRFVSHGTLPPGSRRYRRVMISTERTRSAMPAGPTILSSPIRIPRP
jgi:serine/threonine-protein kinase